jgi:ABC-type polysaccharide/polyol phosphate transport system ATPase subunit
MSKSCVTVNNLSVEYPLRKRLTATEDSRFFKRGRRSFFRALDGINFQLEDGDALGVMGANGSGKSTLLRALAGIVHPSHGDILLQGRIDSALDINLGFRPELTGRENIELKLLSLAVAPEEIPALTDSIIAFCDLGRFMDLPMNTYSAGMKARIAFGVATSRNPDVLILDEWIGVGDRVMREEAMKRMAEWVKQSGILVLASHNQEIMQRVCSKGLVLIAGKAAFLGNIDEALAYYEEAVKPQAGA